jgi:glycosyltransferase involved in cell wall biosynthesis
VILRKCVLCLTAEHGSELQTMSNPRVSILMATWNRAKMIDKTIESIFDQTFTDWELVIADDGSTDDTAKVIEKWEVRDPRIIYVRNPINQGISNNYNSGFKIMKGEYVAMIDDDDPWCDREKLKKQVEFLDNNREYVGCGGGVIVVETNHKEKYRYFKPETDGEIRKLMLFSNPMANSTTMFRRNVGEKVGWYDESNRYSGDRDFWMKMGKIGKLYNFKEYFSYYTMSGANTSIAKIRPHLKSSLTFMKRYKNDYPNYYPALALNQLQYAYSFLPEFIRKLIHSSLARLKRMVVG